MPPLSSIFIRVSLLYLLAGAVGGNLLLVEKAFRLNPHLWAILPAHIECLLLGWLVQLAMATAFWILPRHESGPARGDERIAWAAMLLFNLGIVLFSLSSSLDWPSPVMLTARILESAAAILFLVHAWPRVRALDPLSHRATGAGE